MRISDWRSDVCSSDLMGFDTGIAVEHPLDPDWHLPVWVVNYVLMDYGTGAIFGCPAHDQRDLDFAYKYELPVYRVIADGDEIEQHFKGDEAYTGPGKPVNKIGRASCRERGCPYV